MKSPKRVYQNVVLQTETNENDGTERSKIYQVELVTPSGVVLSDENGNGIRVTAETIGKQVKKGETVKLNLP